MRFAILLSVNVAYEEQTTERETAMKRIETGNADRIEYRESIGWGPLFVIPLMVIGVLTLVALHGRGEEGAQRPVPCRCPSGEDPRL